jgi:hypothetical protein
MQSVVSEIPKAKKRVFIKIQGTDDLLSIDGNNGAVDLFIVMAVLIIINL